MNELSRFIAAEIRQKGPISVARFMELALYCPVYGYYERDADSVGKRGDFQTNVSVGPVFGELVAARIAAWLDRLEPCPAGPLQLVEAGAHDGQLASDILGWLRRWRPEGLDGVEYHLLEPSAVRQKRQKTRLVEFPQHVRWHRSWDQLKSSVGGVHGVIFSNELLDAQPTCRFAWDRAQGVWFEWRVGLLHNEFQWVHSDIRDVEVHRVLGERIPSKLQEVLPDHYVVEWSPAAEQWWNVAAGALKRGWLLTFDYGFDDDTALMPERTGGTLRSYRRHQVVSDVLANPGMQDITVHVHFGEIRRAGERAGLATEFCGEQGRFLTQCVADLFQSNEAACHFDAKRLRQFKTLIHPDHFGRSFRALLQSRL